MQYRNVGSVRSLYALCTTAPGQCSLFTLNFTYPFHRKPDVYFLPFFFKCKHVSIPCMVLQ
jgi:hypothetical protein